MNIVTLPANNIVNVVCYITLIENNNVNIVLMCSSTFNCKLSL